MNTSRIAIIGAGKVGSVLASCLNAQGCSVIEVMSRSSSSAMRLSSTLGAHIITDVRELTADIILITVSDRAISSVAESLAIPMHSGRTVLHTSGAAGCEILAAAQKAGLHTGSIHPLFSFARTDLTISELTGTYYAIDGDETAIRSAEMIARTLDGHPFRLPSDKRALYHASAVAASNYLVTLLLTSARQLSYCGLPQTDAFRALLPLVRGTLDNLSLIGKAALTGPIARGDAITIDKHLHTLSENCPDILPLYRLLGDMTLDIAEANGQLPADAKRIIHQLLRRDIHEQTHFQNNDSGEKTKSDSHHNADSL